MIDFQTPKQQDKTGRPGHFGAARLCLWAASPPSYLSAPPAHPVELRARRGSCRLGPTSAEAEFGLVVHASAAAASRPPAGTRGSGSPSGLAASQEILPWIL